jgi:hypothetical protein
VGALRARSVTSTPELARIRSLPRRKLSKAAAALHAAKWTEALALRKSAELRPWQGQVFEEVVRYGGAWPVLPVGQGKTILAELTPVVLEDHVRAAKAKVAKHERKRVKPPSAVLILPASLRDKTYHDRRAFAGVWALASPPPRVTTREELQIEANAYLLTQLDPDVIVIDESDEGSNWDASTVQRIHRFVHAKRARGKAAGLPWPHGLWVVAMTGTPSRRSILGYWHVILWCLGEQNAPVPAKRAEAERWALALDDAAPRMGFRPNPGALGATLDEARLWYLDRLRETPGVVIVDEDSAADVPLTLKVELASVGDDAIDSAFDDLRLEWTSPSGEPVSDPLSLLRIEGDLGCGLYRYWKPAPPDEWTAARQALAKFVRKRIADTRHAFKPLDTEAMVIRRHPDHPVVVEWKRVRKTFDPLKSSRTKWLSEATLRSCAAWLARQERAGRGPCVIWCGGVEFGKRLSEELGVPYYGRQGKDVRTGRGLFEADARKHMVCSWHANKRGFNLQAWRTHAIVQPPQSAKYLEQVFGRSHRAGQTDHVRFTILATSGGTIDAFRAAMREARFCKQTTGTTQKILRARVKPMPELPELLRWAVRDEEDFE